MLSGTYAEAELKDFSEPIDEDEEADNYEYYSDSDLEDDYDIANDMVARTPKKTALPKSNSIDLVSLLAKEKKSTPACGEWNETSREGVIVKIRDIAFVTYAF